MSVTVEQLLKLPSLSRAKVVGGRGGLSKVVSSISVLESTDPGALVDDVFPQGGPDVKFCVSVFRQSQEWRWKTGRILAWIP